MKNKGLTTQDIIDLLRLYAKKYHTPPYGREIEGTDELLVAAADALKQLVSYEHIGLQPKQVRKIANVLQQFGEEYNCWFNYVADFICKYAPAEQDGRLVVLPFQIGDDVYRIATRKKYIKRALCTSYIKKVIIKPENVHKYITEIGKTVYLTREEAEAALEAQKGCEE